MPKKVNHFKGLSPVGALAKLNSLPITRIDTPYESPKDRIAREIREEERARIARRTAPIVAEENKARAAAEVKIKRFWSQPMTTIAQVFDPNAKRTATWADALVPRNDDGQADVNLGAFPTASTYAEDAALAAFENFKKTVTQRTGVVLSPVGEYRVFAFVMRQSDLQSADPTSEEMWFTALNRLSQLEAFAEGEYGYDESLRTVAPSEPAPVAAPSLIDSSTPEGRELEKHIVREAYRDISTPLFYEWCTSLANGFGFYVTEQQQEEALNVFRERNFSLLDRRSYDRVRLILVHRGVFPDWVRTPDEKLSDEIEAAGDISSYEGKRRIVARIAELQRGSQPIQKNQN